jgi:cytochrome o ubiquinol oxidase subunit 1
MQLYVSIRDRELTRDIGGDPWSARTVEWATPSPVPAYNFPVIPRIHALDAFAVSKKAGFGYQEPASYRDINLKGDAYVGVITAGFGTALGFGLVWYMWWLAWLSLAVVAVSLIRKALLGDRHSVTIPAAEIKRLYKAWLEEVRAITPVTRAHRPCQVSHAACKDGAKLFLIPLTRQEPRRAGRRPLSRRAFRGCR